MKIVVLTPGTNNTAPLYAPLQDGNDLSIIFYDEMADHSRLPKMVYGKRPDLIYYIGALEAYHGKPVPKVNVLAEIGEIADMVHLCCDGAEPCWWPQLLDYYENGRFKLQVNIDGVRTGPIGERGMTCLFPVAKPKMKLEPWHNRRHAIGFSGGLHFKRPEIVLPLVKNGVLTYRPRTNQHDGTDDSYGSYLGFLNDCRLALNVAYTGGGTGSMHVKARTLEASMMGCLVVETQH